MSRSRRYRRVEKNVISKLFSLFAHFFITIGHVIASVFKACDKKLTIMIVPHSQNKVFNFQTNVFSLLIGFVLVIGIIGSFFFFNMKSAGSDVEIARLLEENRQTLASLDELRDENNNLFQVAKKFQSTLSKSLSMMGIGHTTTTNGVVQGSDLSSLFDVQELSKGSVREATDIRQLTNYLEGAVQPVEQIGNLFESQGALFADIPSVWPLKGGVGHISMAFGQNVHPKYGSWYIHKGLDFSTWRTGDPIIATANGRVVTAAYTADFGYYIIIQHKYGYYTRYAHLNAFAVKKGQTVSQGDVIGFLGNSGVTTGPHLHYEVHIGSEVVDPAKYINVKLSK